MTDEARFTSHEKYYHILDRLLKEDTGPKNPIRKVRPFPFTVKVFVGEIGNVGYILDDASNTYSIVDRKRLGIKIMHWISSWRPGLRKTYLSSISTCENLADGFLVDPPYWAIIKEHPHPFAFKSDRSLCLKRHDFDPVHFPLEQLDKHAPWFCRLFGMIKTNRMAFAARLGSMQFPEKFSRRQAVWMYGPAGGGKSRFQNLINQYTCGTTSNIGNADLKNDFLKGILHSSSAFCVSEGSAAFLESDMFKSLTGDGNHTINKKGIAQFSGKINSIAFMFSNEAPNVADLDEITSRIIDCKVDPVAEEDKAPEKEIDDGIKKELPYIAYFCRNAFEKNARRNGEIITSRDELSLLTTPGPDEIASEIVSNNFAKSDGQYVSRYIIGQFLDQKGIKSPVYKHKVYLKMRELLGSKMVKRGKKSGGQIRCEVGLDFLDVHWKNINMKALGDLTDDNEKVIEISKVRN